MQSHRARWKNRKLIRQVWQTEKEYERLGYIVDADRSREPEVMTAIDTLFGLCTAFRNRSAGKKWVERHA